LWVYLYHLWGHAGRPEFAIPLGELRLDFTPLISLGGAGVTVFFVLSGFLLSMPFVEWQAGQRARPEISNYLMRRILRVFPAYYFQLAVLLTLAMVITGPAALPDWKSLWRHLLMLFVPPPLGTDPINLVWWTLPIEFSFYLMLPFLAALLRPQRWLLLLAGSLLAMWLWRYAVTIHLGDAPIQLRVYSAYQLAGSMDMFGFGMLAALIHVHRASLPGWLAGFLRHNVAVVLGIACLIVAVYWLANNRQYYWDNYQIFYLWTPLLSFGTALLLLAGTGGSRAAIVLLGNRPIVYLGLISYSFYLWHLPVLDWIVTWVRLHGQIVINFPGLLVISIFLTFLVSTVSYLLIERPGMKMWR
jgi:peptidoglycan/LPS O-acetylase OafA/YrhL